MEKAIVFGPLIFFFGIFFLLIFLFLRFIFKLVVKSKNESWKGVVTDKVHNQMRDNENRHKMNNFYYLVVKMEDGSERKIGLSAMMWDKFNKGDKLSKPKGKLFPEKY